MIPCAVFWDIENIEIPKNMSTGRFVELIREDLIERSNLEEKAFYCVYHQNIQFNIEKRISELIKLGIQVKPTSSFSADSLILDLIYSFVRGQVEGCAVILISGDKDFKPDLESLKGDQYPISLHLVHREYSLKLFEIMDFTYSLRDNELVPGKQTRSPVPNRIPTKRSCDKFIAIKKRDCQPIKAREIDSIKDFLVGCDSDAQIGFNNTIWGCWKYGIGSAGVSDRIKGYFPNYRVDYTDDAPQPIKNLLECASMSNISYF